jgi:hypothetical protein
MSGLIALLEQIAVQEAETWPRFADLRKRGVVTHPIPFFGPADRARVLTVGVNPSSAEFEGRNWPSQLAPVAHAERLLHYFDGTAGVPPHPWFTKWASPLHEIGIAHGVDAAHLDVSPRATEAMGRCPVERFLAMLKHDVVWLFRTLELCEQVRCLLIAGTATKAHYLHRFIRLVGPEHGYHLVIATEKRGAAPVAAGTLTGGGRSIPFFFCGVSPSARDVSGLAQRIAENRAYLRGLLAAAPSRVDAPSTPAADVLPEQTGQSGVTST